MSVRQPQLPQRPSVLMVTTAKEVELPVCNVLLVTSVQPSTTVTPWCVLLGITLWLEPRNAPNVLPDKSVPRLQLQGQHVQTVTTVWVDRNLVHSAQQDTPVPKRTKNRSYVVLGSTVQLDLLQVLVLTVMPGISAQQEVLKRTHRLPSVRWVTIALLGQLLKHLVIWELMVAQKVLLSQQPVLIVLKDFTVQLEQLEFQLTAFFVQEGISVQLKPVTTRLTHVLMESSLIIWEQLLLLNALTVQQEDTAHQALMTQCMMVIFALEDLIALKALELLLLTARQARIQKKKEL